MNLAIKTLSILLSILILIGCERNFNVQDHNQPSDLTSEDRSEADANNQDFNENEQQLPNLAEIREGYIKSYNDVRKLDTLIYTNEDTFKIRLKYYSLLDSSVVIPKEFIWEKTEMNRFVTHSFAFELNIKNNEKVILDSTITKRVFKPLLSEQLKELGVIKFPNFSFDKNKQEFIFQLTIWIPVTDLGTGVYFIVDEKGNAKVSEDYN